MFSDYQMQEMSENFIDSFGFQDDEFTESDMNIRLINRQNDQQNKKIIFYLQQRYAKTQQRQLNGANFWKQAGDFWLCVWAKN